MDNNKNPQTGFLPVCPFEIEHPEIQLRYTERDKRLDAVTGCDYTENTETYD
ncbi:MAG: hypothetical protein IKP95_05565 [Ruminococcus sp.]|nr:hypothetical protein [Ruminococcus sp.]